ncbi:sigma factor [Nonomuraea polychroma]|uniref:sigma factor n=1 Tax=Nonomuraea polychroma TaxID=46176 RepID=UPI001F4E45C6|nr:sigma factor [Nonomuraea polychroma]
MLGSFDEAEDLVQEVFLRAWRGRDGFEGRSSLRAWPYRIATNACLDFLDGRSRGRCPTRPIRRPARGCSRSPATCGSRRCPAPTTRRPRWSPRRPWSWRSWSPSGTCRRGSAPRRSCATC